MARDNRSSYKRLKTWFRRNNWYPTHDALVLMANIVDRKVQSKGK